MKNLKSHMFLTPVATTGRGFVGNLALVTACLLIGCGRGDGPPRFDVSGKVTFGGQGVPAGRIQFQPDTSRGNQGPSGHAVITDGQYDTSLAGKGTVGGPHVVVISGFDGRPVPEAELAHGRPLFPEHRTTAELPKAATTLDFDVPATSATAGGR